VTRWVSLAVAGAGSFDCQCLSIQPCSVFTPRSSNRTCGITASGSPTRSARSRPQRETHYRLHQIHQPVVFVQPQVGRAMEPGPGLRPFRYFSGSKAPSLRRRYSVSSVLRAFPTSDTAQPLPRGALVDRPERSPYRISRVAALIPLCHAIVITPAEPHEPG
jgi:hypothetical protein